MNEKYFNKYVKLTYGDIRKFLESVIYEEVVCQEDYVAGNKTERDIKTTDSYGEKCAPYIVTRNVEIKKTRKIPDSRYIKFSQFGACRDFSYIENSRHNGKINRTLRFYTYLGPDGFKFIVDERGSHCPVVDHTKEFINYLKANHHEAYKYIMLAQIFNEKEHEKVKVKRNEDEVVRLNKKLLEYQRKIEETQKGTLLHRTRLRDTERKMQELQSSFSTEEWEKLKRELNIDEVEENVTI